MTSAAVSVLTGLVKVTATDHCFKKTSSRSAWPSKTPELLKFRYFITLMAPVIDFIKISKTTLICQRHVPTRTYCIETQPSLHRHHPSSSQIQWKVTERPSELYGSAVWDFRFSRCFVMLTLNPRLITIYLFMPALYEGYKWIHKREVAKFIKSFHKTIPRIWRQYVPPKRSYLRKIRFTWSN
jgi:hypothetical protein